MNMEQFCWAVLSKENVLTDRHIKTANSYIYIYIYIYIYLCRLAWVDQKRRQVLYQRYIRATQVLYQLPIKTSGESRQMKQLGIFAVVTIE